MGLSADCSPMPSSDNRTCYCTTNKDSLKSVVVIICLMALMGVSMVLL